MTRLTINKIILPIITFIIFLGIWEMVIIIGHYQPVLLPDPALVGKSIWTFIVTGEIFQHLAISLWRFVAGFIGCYSTGLFARKESLAIQRYRTTISIH